MPRSSWWRLALGGVVAATLSSTVAALPARADCRMPAPADLPAVSVHAGGRVWTVGVRGARATLNIAAGAHRVAVEVAAPLQFQGTVPIDSLHLVAPRPIDLFDGRLRVGRRAIGRWSAVPNGLELSLREMLGLGVRPLPVVPCADVRIAQSGAVSVSPRKIRPVPLAGLDHGDVALYATPDGGAPLQIVFDGPVSIIGRRPDWIRIEADWDDGSRLRGWVRAPDLRAAPPAASGHGTGAASSGTVGCTDRPRLVPITVRKGAALAAGPDGAVWAHATEPARGEAFPWRPREAWIRIATLTALPAPACEPHAFVWVRAADLLGAKQ